jgi:hypothetical protein
MARLLQWMLGAKGRHCPRIDYSVQAVPRGLSTPHALEKLGIVFGDTQLIDQEFSGFRSP